MTSWNSEKRATFLYWLESNPCMYAVGTSPYRDKNARRQAINEICSMMDIDTNTVMMKIKSLRTYISNRKMKRLKSGLLSLEDGPDGEDSGEGSAEGQDDVRIKQEVTEEFGDLHFLAPYVMPKASTLAAGMELSNVDQDTFEESYQKLKPLALFKKKKISLEPQVQLQLPTLPCLQTLDDDPDTVPHMRQTSDADPDYHFFMSLYGDFRKIQNSQLRGRLKLDLQRIIYEALFQGILPGQIEF